METIHKKWYDGSGQVSEAVMIAETQIIDEGLGYMLDKIGAPTWTTDAEDPHSKLSEVAGRLCYKSFGTHLNPNITKVREGNFDYVRNVLNQKHGSVFEHSTVSIAFLNVSRILTHELVRHRPGWAYSQESQRFVRLDFFDVYIADLTEAFAALYDELPMAKERVLKQDWVQERQREFLENFTRVQNDAAETLGNLIFKFGLDEPGVSFHTKKTITSALRRMVPGGVNTNILVTGNHRSWRHIIEVRTSPGAEVEISAAFQAVAELLSNRYPAIYQDMNSRGESGKKSYWFLNSKV